MFLLAALLLLLNVAQAQESWREKPPPQWTQEEAVEVLNDSPWAQQVRLWQFSGRQLARLRNGRTVVYRDAPNRPPRQYSVPVGSPEPERVEAVHGVRWSSATIVQQALDNSGSDNITVIVVDTATSAPSMEPILADGDTDEEDTIQ